MSTAYKKGKDFERQVEQILKQNSIEYKEEKRIAGFGKKWLVDFYLPNPPTIIECKNIKGINLERELKYDCLKFLDIRNRFFQMSFILVFPKPQFTMGSFARFCVKYNIKLATLDMLLDSFGKKIDKVNSQFGKLARPKTQTIKLIKASGAEGITGKAIMTKLGWHCKYPHIPLEAPDLVEYGIVKSFLYPIRYFTKENYEKSKEFKFIEDLKMNYLNYSDEYFAKKYDVDLRRITRLRKGRLGLKKPHGGQRHSYNQTCKKKHYIYKLYKSQQKLLVNQ